jgi:hypothetical protein
MIPATNGLVTLSYIRRTVPTFVGSTAHNTRCSRPRKASVPTPSPSTKPDDWCSIRPAAWPGRA